MTENRTPYETLQATIPTGLDRAILRNVRRQRRSSRHAVPGAAAVTQRTQRGRLSLTVDLIGNMVYTYFADGEIGLNCKHPHVLLTQRVGCFVL